MATPTSPTSRLLRSVVFIFAFIVGGGLLGGLLFLLREEPPRRSNAPLPPYVESIVVRAEDVTERYVGYGTAKATRAAKLAAEVSAGVVERVGGIRAGSSVSAGQDLIRLDDREYRLAFERAEARAAAEEAAIAELDVEASNVEELVRTAEKELRVAAAEKARVTDLFERGLAANKEFDFANLAYQQARRVLQGYEREAAALSPRRDGLMASRRAFEADAALAQLNIERCVIKAPFAGRVESVFVDRGDRVAIGTVVLALIDSDRVEIPIQLPGAIYNRVKTGANCRVECESTVGTSWEGQVARIAPAADEQTRTFAAYIVVDNTQQAQALVPGTFVTAIVQGPIHANRILVPRGAFRSGRVFIVEDGVARVRLLAVERFLEERALVRGSIRDGDRVILSHLDRLADGSPVRVGEEHPTSAAASRPFQETGTVSTP